MILPLKRSLSKMRIRRGEERKEEKLQLLFFLSFIPKHIKEWQRAQSEHPALAGPHPGTEVFFWRPEGNPSAFAYSGDILATRLATRMAWTPTDQKGHQLRCCEGHPGGPTWVPRTTEAMVKRESQGNSSSPTQVGVFQILTTTMSIPEHRGSMSALLIYMP